jgi:hypothetical protein
MVPDMGGRLARLVVIVTAATAALTAGPAGAATPHMDRVEAAMRKVAPGLEGIAYKRTHGNRLFRQHFELAAVRFSSSRVWPRAPAQYNKIANHSKLGMVDNCAIWVGSHNLYPFWLADFSLLIEDRRVARIFKRDYADMLCRYSARRGPLPGKACGAIVQHAHASERSDTRPDEVVGLG